MTHVFAAGTSAAQFAQVIAAVASVVSVLVLLYLGVRAQSADKQREDFLEGIQKLIDEKLDAATRGLIIGEIVRRVVRQVLSEFIVKPGGRRFYDPDEDD